MKNHVTGTDWIRILVDRRNPHSRTRVRINDIGLLLCKLENLMAVLLDVLSAAHMYPEVLAIAGLDNGLIEVSVGDDPVKPAVKYHLVGMG